MRCSDWLTFRRGADHRGDPAGDRCDLSLQLPRRSTRWAARCAGAQPSDLGDGAPAGARAAGVLRECRALLETYHDLRAEHTAWVQRIHAVFFHQGAPALGEAALRTDRALQALRAAAACHLSPAGQLQVATALGMLAALNVVQRGRVRLILALPQPVMRATSLCTPNTTGASSVGTPGYRTAWPLTGASLWGARS